MDRIEIENQEYVPAKSARLATQVAGWAIIIGAFVLGSKYGQHKARNQTNEK